jgi:L,D-transpeptidase-like protein/sporulation and spore germination protein/putative peptidoglycan binding protein
VRRVRLAIPAAVGASALVLAAPALGAPEARRGEVWFLHDGEPVAVTRVAPKLPGLMRSLLAGPTRAERAKGLRSAVPTGTAVRELTIAHRVVTVDLSARFAAGRDEASLTARVGQLVRTLRSAPGVVGVRVRVEGGVPVGLFPGYDLRRTVRAPLAEGLAPSLRETQQLLADLGFMAESGVTGRPGDETSVAVLAFEKWSGLPRDGVLDDDVVRALARATRPEPVRHAPGRRVELLLDRQLALAILDGKVVRVFHVSSGAGGRTPTGSFRVYRKERLSWSVPFKVWMPWASYFTGGIAFHEYGYVPAYPASHGCVRMMARDAPLMFAFATSGTPVDVIPVTA